MEKSPLVSVCLPAYNASDYIEETIACLLDQTYPNLEIIIVEDHSTDDTWEILGKYNSDPIKVCKSQKKGAAAARNQAYSISKGNYVIFFDADDLVSSNFIESQLSKLNGDNNKVVISKWGRFYNADLNTYKEDPFIIRKDLTFKEWVVGYWTYNRHTTPPGRVLIPRQVIDKAGLWDETLSLNDDFDFFVKVFAQVEKILFNADADFYYRSGIGGLSSKKIGFEYQLSNFKSCCSGIGVALRGFGEDKIVRKACANVLQNFVYENYPLNKSLVKNAQDKIKELGGSDYPFPAGGLTEKLVKLIGWKLVKRLKVGLKAG